MVSYAPRTARYACEPGSLMGVLMQQRREPGARLVAHGANAVKTPVARRRYIGCAAPPPAPDGVSDIARETQKTRGSLDGRVHNLKGTSFSSQGPASQLA